MEHAQKPSDSSAAEAKAPDPVALAQQMLPLLERARELLHTFAQQHANDFAFHARVGAQATQAFQELYAQWLRDPVRLAQAQVAWWRDYLQLVHDTGKRWAGEAVATHTPAHPAGARDKRFADPAWHENATFDLIKQTYLLTARWMQALVKDTPDLDPHAQQKIAFYTRQFIDALSPTNFAATNPQVLRAFAETGGENFVQGLRNMLRDMEAGQGQIRISMTDPHAFVLGHSVATTPGRVVFKNDMMELIQYSPTTPTVHSTPLLIIPPWINKYYILDLRPDNSFVRYAVAQGHTVFMVSWVNPTAAHAQKNFEDYMTGGALAALDAIDRICGTTQTNVIGYCLGGTLLAATLAHLHARGTDSRIASATYFVTMIDFSQPGDLGVFIDEQQIIALEALMFDKGYLPASAMAATFSMLRANDLVWSFVIHNYMLGHSPLPFDLLYWNSDSTNMPAAMHSYYLRNMYLHNRLCQPNALKLLGTPIDVRSIATPAYIISTRDDHIAPWQATYAATQLFSGPVQFVLGGSGHIAGIVNPPAADGGPGKYSYFTNTENPPAPDTWLTGATEHKGSWWPHWAAWQAAYGNGMVPAREPNADAPPAPGDYVKVRA
jgi:polyhydroxyalkanoate synthase